MTIVLVSDSDDSAFACNLLAEQLRRRGQTCLTVGQPLSSNRESPLPQIEPQIHFPVEQLHATGGPPVPTISMVLDDGLQNQQEIEWTRNGKAYRFRVDLTEVARARAAVSSFEVFPDLAEVTRYPLGSYPTIVQTARGG